MKKIELSNRSFSRLENIERLLVAVFAANIVRVVSVMSAILSPVFVMMTILPPMPAIVAILPTILRRHRQNQSSHK